MGRLGSPQPTLGPASPEQARRDRERSQQEDAARREFISRGGAFRECPTPVEMVGYRAGGRIDLGVNRRVPIGGSRDKSCGSLGARYLRPMLQGGYVHSNIPGPLLMLNREDAAVYSYLRRRLQLPTYPYSFHKRPLSDQQNLIARVNREIRTKKGRLALRGVSQEVSRRLNRGQELAPETSARDGSYVAYPGGAPIILLERRPLPPPNLPGGRLVIDWNSPSVVEAMSQRGATYRVRVAPPVYSTHERNPVRCAACYEEDTSFYVPGLPGTRIDNRLILTNVRWTDSAEGTSAATGIPSIDDRKDAAPFGMPYRPPAWTYTACRDGNTAACRALTRALRRSGLDEARYYDGVYKTYVPEVNLRGVNQAAAAAWMNRFYNRARWKGVFPFTAGGVTSEESGYRGMRVTRSSGPGWMPHLPSSGAQEPSLFSRVAEGVTEPIVEEIHTAGQALKNPRSLARYVGSRASIAAQCYASGPACATKVLTKLATDAATVAAAEMEPWSDYAQVGIDVARGKYGDVAQMGQNLSRQVSNIDPTRLGAQAGRLLRGGLDHVKEYAISQKDELSKRALERANDFLTGSLRARRVRVDLIREFGQQEGERQYRALVGQARRYKELVDEAEQEGLRELRRLHPSLARAVEAEIGSGDQPLSLQSRINKLRDPEFSRNVSVVSRGINPAQADDIAKAAEYTLRGMTKEAFLRHLRSRASGGQGLMPHPADLVLLAFDQGYEQVMGDPVPRDTLIQAGVFKEQRDLVLRRLAREASDLYRHYGVRGSAPQRRRDPIGYDYEGFVSQRAANMAMLKNVMAARFPSPVVQKSSVIEGELIRRRGGIPLVDMKTGKAVLGGAVAFAALKLLGFLG